MLHSFLLAISLGTLAATPPAPPAPNPRELVAEHSLVFSYSESASESELSGPGGDFLRAQTANSQFVLLGEVHSDHAVPLFAGALYQMLHDTHAFRYLVVEQDPIAIEAALAPALRGKVDGLAALSKRYPSLFEFDSDEDLELLARVGRLENNADAIWGVEQTTGAIRYLEELVGLAPDTVARNQAQALLDAARAADHEPKYSVNWLVAASTPAAIATLAEAYAAKPNSRAARLLSGLAKSSEIFGYYRRAEAGEFVGLYNNTVREDLLKANFLERYRAASAHATTPRAMFKFGSNHLYHGRNPTQAFPIGNLAHELAIVDGMQAYGLYVVALGPDYTSYKDFPNWIHPLLPASEPTVPTLVDLHALRPYQRLFRELVTPADQWQLGDLINGYDALVVLPGSRPATRQLDGRADSSGRVARRPD